MIGEIIVNGKSSKDFQVYLSDAGVYGMPERDVTTIRIDGRDGDLIVDNNRYKNLDISFPCIIVDNFSENYSAFVGYLLSQRGYLKIENSFLPDEYVLGRYKNNIDPTTKTYGNKGNFVITFDRKPQRFLKGGDVPMEFTASGSLYNPYTGIALPKVRVYGTGEVAIGDTTITVNSVDQYVDIDCELQDAYKGTTNCNGNITLNNNKFFELAQGVNNFTVGNGISKIVITPRWWKL